MCAQLGQGKLQEALALALRECSALSKDVQLLDGLWWFIFNLLFVWGVDALMQLKNAGLLRR